MEKYTTNQIKQLQDNLEVIRKTGGWSAEEFGDMIGVTKQTISNLENKKTPMSKTQYIAIRAVLDYEIAERKDDTALISMVNLCLNSDNLSADEIKKAQAFVEGAAKTGLDRSAIVGGLITLIGSVAAAAILPTLATPVLTTYSMWIKKLLQKK